MFPIKPSNPSRLLSSLDVIPCSFDRNQILHVLQLLRESLSSKTLILTRNMDKMKHILSDMYILLFSNRSLYSVCSELDIQHVSFELKWILIHWNHVNLDPEFLNTLILIVFKFYKNASASPKELGLVLWDILSLVKEKQVFMKGLLDYKHVWNSFLLDELCCSECLQWKEDPISLEFTHYLIIHSKMIQNPCWKFKEMLVQILIRILNHSLLIWPVKEDRRIVLESWRMKLDFSWNLSLQELELLLNGLPTSFNTLVDRLQDWEKDCDPFLFLLHICFSRFAFPLTFESFQAIQNYILKLIQHQINDSNVVTFKESMASDILSFVLLSSEEFDIEHQLSFHSQSLNVCIDLLNTCPKTSSYYGYLWSGILQGLLKTMYPLDYLDSCTRFSLGILLLRIF